VKLRILIACVLSLTVAAISAPERAAASRGSDSSGLVVHEWGTFLAMNGSDGVSLDGMYHEEHALPSFVHARSRDQLRMPMSRLKGETPVIYFYPRNVMKVRVDVDFPTGLWTQWYPQATTVSPGLVQAGSPPRTRDGRISWDVTVRPATMKNGTLPETSTDALWNHSRDVDAAYVYANSRPSVVAPYPAAPGSSGTEAERFIFYRGLGEVPLPIDVRLANGRLSGSTSERAGLHHLFILRVENGRGAYSYRTTLSPDEQLDEAVPSMDKALPIDRFVEEVSVDVARRLYASGLYEPEALAMVNTWKSSYFKTDGVRLLFVMPQSWTDRFIPMRIEPKPQELVRVMVGRVELLDAQREQRAEEAIRNLASPVSSVRERAFETLRGEGRYVEPIVRRALKTTTDEQVRTLSKRLLLTDFVTELRTALTDAATGEKVNAEPVFVRAQLASLLREVGLDAEAKQEGEAALAQLATMRQPTLHEHQSRHMYRALARAHEGAGHDAEALRWYGQFVEFGSQFQQPRMCAGCHTTMGPRDMSFFRDWYAGRKFGEYAVKTGEAPRLIAAHQTTLGATPSNVASQLSLAYLYEATGESANAQTVWDAVSR
jgi:hypothetical protein